MKLRIACLQGPSAGPTGMRCHTQFWCSIYAQSFKDLYTFRYAIKHSSLLIKETFCETFQSVFCGSVRSVGDGFRAWALPSFLLTPVWSQKLVFSVLSWEGLRSAPGSCILFLSLISFLHSGLKALRKFSQGGFSVSHCHTQAEWQRAHQAPFVNTAMADVLSHSRPLPEDGMLVLF